MPSMMKSDTIATVDGPVGSEGGCGMLRDNLDENGATIWVRIGGRVLG